MFQVFVRAIKPSTPKILFLTVIAATAFVQSYFIERSGLEFALYFTAGNTILAFSVMLVAVVMYISIMDGEKFSPFLTVFVGFLFGLLGVFVILIP